MGRKEDIEELIAQDRKAGTKISKNVTRPLGVTILSVMGFLSGGLFLLVGLIALLAGGMIAGFVEGLGPLLGGLAGLLGILFLVVGIIGTGISFLLWKMNKIGMWLAVGLNILSIISMAATEPMSNIGSIVFSLLVVGYLIKIRKQFS